MPEGQCIDEIVWSPCDKFIAVARRGLTEVLDATTLSRHSTFAESPKKNGDFKLNFSPDGSFLMRFDTEYFVSWDFQTGGPLHTITSGLTEGKDEVFSSTFSMDGKVVAVACVPRPNLGFNHDGDDHSDNNSGDDTDDIFRDDSDILSHSNSDTFILTYDLLSGARRSSYRTSKNMAHPIWAHGECFRFATVESSSIIVWEAPFVRTHAPIKVESLPVPDKITDGMCFLFLPTLSRLAFMNKYQRTILIWDAKASKFLLKSEPIPSLHFGQTANHDPPRSSFSPDGRLFASMCVAGEVYVWKESPTGYALHQKLPFGTPATTTGPRFSTNGDSIITSVYSKLNLWPTKNRILPLSDSLIEKRNLRGFILEFSLDGVSVAFVRWGENAVTIVDLRSGDSRIAIDTGETVDYVGSVMVGGSDVVIVGKGKATTWSLPEGNRTFNFRASVKDAVQTTTLDRSQSSRCLDLATCKSTRISPDLRRIAVMVYYSQETDCNRLEIYDVSTGRRLGCTGTRGDLDIRFTQDGRQLWGTFDDSGFEGWEIIENGGTGTIELVSLGASAYPVGVFPWKSPHGYKVTDDGWVLSPTQKRLLWLPHRWRSGIARREDMAWSGRFLGLSNGGLSEVVILEFLE